MLCYYLEVENATSNKYSSRSFSKIYLKIFCFLSTRSCWCIHLSNSKFLQKTKKLNYSPKDDNTTQGWGGGCSIIMFLLRFKAQGYKRNDNTSSFCLSHPLLSVPDNGDSMVKYNRLLVTSGLAKTSHFYRQNSKITHF